MHRGPFLALCLAAFGPSVPSINSQDEFSPNDTPIRDRCAYPIGDAKQITPFPENHHPKHHSLQHYFFHHP